jgi:hypothetical protein
MPDENSLTLRPLIRRAPISTRSLSSTLSRFGGIAYDPTDRHGSTWLGVLLCAALAVEATASRFRATTSGVPNAKAAGALATVWLYVRPWWFVAGRIGGLLFLLVATWFFCAIPATAALVPLFSAFGIGDNWDWLNAFRWLTGLFAFGSLVLVLCYVRDIVQFGSRGNARGNAGISRGQCVPHRSRCACDR